MKDRTDQPTSEPSPEDTEPADEPDYWPTVHREPAPSPAQHNAAAQADRAARQARR